MKNLLKKLGLGLSLLACLLILQSVSIKAQSTVSDTILTTEASNTDNTESAEIGIPNWKIFENTVAKKLTASSAFPQVYLQVTISGVVKTIIPDFLVLQANGKYKVIDAKASSITDLSTTGTPDLTARCTANQKVAYPAINAGSISAKVVSARNSLDSSKSLTTGQTISLEVGVQFYVNVPKGQYTAATARNLK